MSLKELAVQCVEKIQERFAEAKTLEQILKDVRDGLEPLPKQGDLWKATARYITGDEAMDGKTLYVALKFNQNKKPSDHPVYWEKKAIEPSYPKWNDIPDGTIIYEKDIVELDGLWICTTQHMKSTVYKPKEGSSRWVRYEG